MTDTQPTWRFPATFWTANVVELCERAAAEVARVAGVPALRIEWKPLSAGERIDAVARGAVDLECGMTTISLSRMATVDFSMPIYVDGGAVLVSRRAKLGKLADGPPVSALPRQKKRPETRVSGPCEP